MKLMNEQHLAVLRRHMVEMIDIHYDLMGDEIGRTEIGGRLREAILKIPRHMFVPAQLASVAYHDTPLPLAFDKTISQPFIACLMIDLLDVQPGDRLLEIGTGLGYQAAIMAEMGAQVFSVDIVEEFAQEARVRLEAIGQDGVTLRVGDGSRGWQEHAPFDRILVTAAARAVPEALVDQLEPGGRIVLPVGEKDQIQQLTVGEKAAGGTLHSRDIMPVRFTQLETVI